MSHVRPPEIYEAYGEPCNMLNVTGCRFKVEKLDLFCNAEQSGNSAYCARHRAVCGGR